MTVEFASSGSYWLFADMLPKEQKTLFAFGESGEFTSQKTGRKFDKIVLLGSAKDKKTGETLTGDFNLATFNIELDADDKKEFGSWDGLKKALPDAKLELWTKTGEKRIQAKVNKSVS